MAMGIDGSDYCAGFVGSTPLVYTYIPRHNSQVLGSIKFEVARDFFNASFNDWNHVRRSATGPRARLT